MHITANTLIRPVYQNSHINPQALNRYPIKEIRKYAKHNIKEHPDIYHIHSQIAWGIFKITNPHNLADPSIIPIALWAPVTRPNGTPIAWKQHRYPAIIYHNDDYYIASSYLHPMLITNHITEIRLLWKLIIR